MKKHQKSATREWIETIIIAVVLALFVRTFFVQSFKIPSGSMRKTLMEGDKILVNKLIYGPRIPFTHIELPSIREPKTGDIVVFKYPEDPKRDFIKRLIASENQSVEIKDNHVLVDGQRTGVEKIDKNIYYANGTFGDKEIKVPAENYYVLGDNSYVSKDSRYWGYVPKDNMVGKAFFIFWPPHRIGILK
jgi:signal peptidase I